jgi:hypothetical protein
MHPALGADQVEQVAQACAEILLGDRSLIAV